MGINDFPNRIYEILNITDLRELRDLAVEERALFFERNPHLIKYREKLIAVCLCQGAALHYVNQKNGVKDFDIWYFYKDLAALRYPYRALRHTFINLPKFGTKPVDLLGRTIDSSIVKVALGEPSVCIQEYLQARRTTTARKLSEKAVIGLYPDHILGKTIWPKQY